MKLKVIVHPAEEGGFWAEVPALPGCVSEGDTLDETMANIREAAEGWLEVADARAERDATTQLAETNRRRFVKARMDFRCADTVDDMRWSCCII